MEPAGNTERIPARRESLPSVPARASRALGYQEAKESTRVRDSKEGRRVERTLLFPVLYLGDSQCCIWGISVLYLEDFCVDSHQEFPGTTFSLLWVPVSVVTLPKPQQCV